MEINYDTDFDICDTCPSLHDCEAHGTCKIQEIITEDVDTLTAWIDEHTVVQDRGEK